MYRCVHSNQDCVVSVAMLVLGGKRWHVWQTTVADRSTLSVLYDMQIGKPSADI